MKIIVDAFGGDNAPLEILKGCEMAVNEYDVDILLTGDENIIKKVATENKISLESMEIVHAPEVMLMTDHPRDIVHSKKNTSLAVALRLLAEGKGDGFVGAGSTGAILVGSTMIVKRIKGIKRPALAAVMPKFDGFFMLTDCGANADCRPEMLVQFAKMGSIYMEKVMKVKNPRIGLVNNGTEETKGGELQKETFPLLKDSGLNFIGNVEARDIPYDGCDVAIADGFTGNVILKLYEGVAGALMSKFKGVFSKNLKNKLAASVVYGDMKALKQSLDYNEYGGAPFLGVQKPVFKAHGSSKAKTFKNAIGLLKEYIDNNVISEIEKSINTAK